jgi:two-component system OmpR family sensor kinase
LIRGYTELIFDNNALDQAHIARIRVRVSDQIERMQNLISDLLLLAEIGEHGATDFSTVNLTHVVQQAFEDLQTIQPRRPISVSLCEDAMVHADGRLVDQLLANLISNLSRYVPVKAPVSVKLEKNESQVTLVVEDGGPGLPNQATNEELQSFRRFDPSRSRTSGGSGLGLSIMNAIVQQHGGKMILSRSRLGGLKTLIELPVRG